MMMVITIIIQFLTYKHANLTAQACYGTGTKCTKVTEYYTKHTNTGLILEQAKTI